MRISALALRIIKQLLNDKRTLALILLCSINFTDFNLLYLGYIGNRH